MDAVRFLKELDRICTKTQCAECVMNIEHREYFGFVECAIYITENPSEAVALVEQWSKEHPQKTRLQDFLSKYRKELSSDKL